MGTTLPLPFLLFCSINIGLNITKRKGNKTIKIYSVALYSKKPACSAILLVEGRKEPTSPVRKQLIP
jgi:hypothetical protein